MSSDHVNIVITSDSVGPTLAGFGTGAIPSFAATWAERTRTYTGSAGVLVDFIATSPEAVFATAYFGQTPRPEKLKIVRCALAPTQKYTLTAFTAPVAGSRYQLSVAGKGVTATDIDITLLADVAITAVANATNAFTATAHGMTTGDGPYRLTNSGGGLPAGSAVDTDYWIISLTANTFSIASSYANAITPTAVDITTDGTGTHTLQRDANDVLIALLVDRLNAVVGKNYTAVQTPGAGDTDTLTVTASAAGNWFSLEVKNRGLLTLAEDNIDPGIATDLAAINLEDPDWRTFIPTFQCKAMIKAAAAWIEAAVLKDMIVASADTAIVRAVSTGSACVLDDLKTSGYKKTHLFFHGSPVKACAAAFAGIYLTTTPGSETAKFHQPVGPGAVTLTDTEKTNLIAKNGNWLGLDSGLTFTQNSRAVGGRFFDLQRADDFVATRMRGRILAVLVNVKKTPLTDRGIAKVANMARGFLDEISNPESDSQIYASYVLEVPKAKDVSSADRATRTISGIKWSATYAGAIENVKPVTGVISL